MTGQPEYVSGGHHSPDKERIDYSTLQTKALDYNMETLDIDKKRSTVVSK